MGRELTRHGAYSMDVKRVEAMVGLHLETTEKFVYLTYILVLIQKIQGVGKVSLLLLELGLGLNLQVLAKFHLWIDCYAHTNNTS